jgi:hypothetical protein
MSTEKTPTPEDGTTSISPTEHWRELEGRTGDAPDAEDEIEASRVESGAKEAGRKRVLTRRAQIVVAAVLSAFAVALALIVVGALVGGGSTPKSRSAPEGLPAKAGKSDEGRPGRARWVREPDQPARPRQERIAPPAPHVRRHARPRYEPARSPSVAPSQPPVSAAAPEPAPAPSEPPPPPPREPAGKPGLRDGATESAEFGL